MSSPSLVAITMLARSGATALAWARFEAGGFAPDDPAALAVKGRLLKDRARAATGDAARTLYAEAAAAYARAAAIDGTTYPLINAATLTLLGGDAAGAARFAEVVLGRLDSGRPDQETPYYRGATRAEALLLLGRRAEAEQALVAAMALAPEAFEDHATTLRQFALIDAVTGADSAWLDAHRPRRTLHFAGRIAAPLNAAEQAALVQAITEMLVAERIGSAYGALAAGADLVIAETILAHGAALHVVLPASVAAFRAASVAPFGAGWLPRFDAVLAAATSIDAGPATAVDDCSIALAAERAMGRAITAADRHATSAVQLVVPSPDDGPESHTARQARTWAASGRRQHSLAWPSAVAERTPADTEIKGAQHLVALLELTLDPMAPASALVAIRAALAAHPAAIAAITTDSGVRLAWADPAVAAGAATTMLAALDPAWAPRLFGHFAALPMQADPFGSGIALFGPEVARAARLAAVVPAGACYVSDDFLAGLVLRSDNFRHEYVGEAPGERGDGDLPLHAVVARPS